MKHIIKDLVPHRPLKEFEYDVLESMLSHNFQGQTELFKQLDGVKVSSECKTCPTVEFVVPSSYPKAEVKHRIPVEAVAEDSDGVKIHFLVHVVNGYLFELEVFREDSERILKIPDIDSLLVF